MRTATTRALALLLAASLGLAGPALCTRAATASQYDLRGSYFGSFQAESAEGGGEGKGFVLPKLDPAGEGGDAGTKDQGTAVLCLCSSEALPSEDESPDDLHFDVDGIIAFLQNDKIGHKFPLSGRIRCAPAAPGKAESVCRYAGGSGAEVSLTLDLAAGGGAAGGSPRVAVFNVSSSSHGKYTGHIGSKLPALDSVCDDIACRRSANYVVQSGPQAGAETKTGAETETRIGPEEDVEPEGAAEIAVKGEEVGVESPPAEAPEAPKAGPLPSSAGRDGSAAANAVGQRRCGGGGEKGKPDCGDQGFCEDEATGAACYWDCGPGWCSCTSGTCFDEGGRCSVPSTYPESNNWQSTCSYGGEQADLSVKEVDPEAEEGRGNAGGGVVHDAGRDGANPPNAVESLRCGGEKGKPRCGDMGFCLDERTGDRCFWDCDPGWCSCNSGACFDATGRCTEPATYPESNDWKATCKVRWFGFE